MNTIQAWLKAHSISSQTVAAAWIGGTVLFHTNPEFHDYIFNAYSSLPHGLHSFVTGIVVPIAIFWRSTHTTKVTAEVEDGAPAVASASASATIAPDGK